MARLTGPRNPSHPVVVTSHPMGPNVSPHPVVHPFSAGPSLGTHPVAPMLPAHSAGVPITVGPISPMAQHIAQTTPLQLPASQRLSAQPPGAVTTPFVPQASSPYATPAPQASQQSSGGGGGGGGGSDDGGNNDDGGDDSGDGGGDDGSGGSDDGGNGGGTTVIVVQDGSQDYAQSDYSSATADYDYSQPDPMVEGEDY